MLVNAPFFHFSFAKNNNNNNKTQNKTKTKQPKLEQNIKKFEWCMLYQILWKVHLSLLK